MENDQLSEQCNALADTLQKRGEQSLTYHEQLAYNDLRMAAQNLQWANAKRAEKATTHHGPRTADQ